MSRFFQQLSYSPDKIQLICFPFAGGYSASFRPLHAYLQDHCNLLVADPPGHGTNRMPAVEKLEHLVDMYLQELLPGLGKPFALFGHSMGGMVVYRLAQRLERQGIFPKSIIISAIQPPHISRKALAHLDDEAFLEYVIGIGGIPSEVVKVREVLEFFLPSFRADFKALESFEHTDHTLLQSPVHIFNGQQDEICLNDASAWKEYAYGVRFQTFQGGHMFILSETEQVAKAIQFVVTTDNAREAVTKT
jgi:external thioesterase TEII